MSTYDSLKKAIENNGDVKSVLRGQSTEDIKEAFLLTDSLKFSLLQIAVMKENKQAVVELLDKAKEAEILRDFLEQKAPSGSNVLNWAREKFQNNKSNEMIKIIEQRASEVGLTASNQQNKPPVGTEAPFQEVEPTVTTQSGHGHGQAQGEGSVLTASKLMENFSKLTKEQVAFYTRLSKEIVDNEGVDNILKGIEEDEDKKGILTADFLYCRIDKSIPDKTVDVLVTHDLLTLAINHENIQATKEILAECKQLGILEQVLTTQSLHIVDGRKERSLYALHHAIFCSDTKFCTEILDAASDEPGLLQKILNLELIYTKNTDGIKTYTPLQLAQANRNTEAINIINRKIHENGLTQQTQPHVNTGGAEPILLSQSGQTQAQVTGDMGDQQKKDEDNAIRHLMKLKNENFNFHSSEGQEVLTAIIENKSASAKVIDVLFNQGILTTENTVILLNELVYNSTNLLNLNGHFVEKVIEHITSNNTQGTEDLAQKVILAVHYTFDVMDKDDVQNVSYLERVVQSLEPLKSNDYIREEIDAFYTKTRRTLSSRDPQQQKIFGELRDLVLQSNGAKDAEQSRLINAFSQKLNEALSSDFDFFAEFKIDGFFANTAVQFVTRYSNNQQCIKTFLNKILSSTQDNAANSKHISDSVTFSLNIEAIKAWSNIMKEKNVIEGIDQLASNTLTYLIAKVREMKPQDSGSFGKLCKVKTILNFLSEQSVKKETKSMIQKHLYITEEEMEKAKPFSWEARQAQFSSPPPVGAQASSGAKATPSAPIVTRPDGYNKLQSNQQALYDKIAQCNGVTVSDILKGTDVKDVIAVLSIINDYDDTLLTDHIRSDMEAAKTIFNHIKDEGAIGRVTDALENKALDAILRNNNGVAKKIIEFSQSYQKVQRFIYNKLREEFKEAVKASNFDNADKLYKFGEENKIPIFKDDLLKGTWLSDTISEIKRNNNDKFLVNTLEFAQRHNMLDEVLNAKNKGSNLLELAEKEKVKAKVEKVINDARLAAPVHQSVPSVAKPAPGSAQNQPFQPPVGVPASPAAEPASGQSFLFQQAKKDQPNLTPVVATVSPAAQAIPSISTTVGGSSSDDTSALPDDLGDQSTKAPTFWSENRGKIAFSLGVVGAVIAGCAFIAGLPYEAACAIAVIGVIVTAIAVGILGKMAYDAVSEQDKTDNTSKLEATGSMLSVLPINLQEESKGRG
ncbi:hypothetical protein [Wolbachia endosymbiont of Folsomia candida]|uniref:hypothetical protein n=1 Tax=Wolbachia endosymbiont of Folsomia candida TaxID=169402 RepID=UPI000A820EDA|nr:hypothetical protein [Wolbachia endosymbiont of Folsomia candida]APR97789.1 hypothetical protein ASM33_00305 [Wolbachia endosymbiont of Folsomia candida]